MPKIDDHGKASPPWIPSPSSVYYKGPCKPAVTGRTLRFVRNEWRPGKKDDVFLIFQMHTIRAGKGYSPPPVND